MATDGVVMETQEPNATRHAYLADFTVGDARLKSAHVDFLAKVLASIAADPSAKGFEGWIVTLWGKTSRTGSAQLNRAIAGRRTAAVREHLEQRLRALSGHRVKIVEFPWEEEMAGPDDSKESEFHRSVEIWLTKVPVIKPRNKPAVPKKEWACMRFWLDAKKLSIVNGRLVNGYLVSATSEGEPLWYGWWFSVKGLGMSVFDPRFVGDFRTAASKPIFYDPKLVRLPDMLPGKLLWLGVAADLAQVRIVNVLPREPDDNYEPIKGLRDTRDLVVDTKFPKMDAELGGFAAAGVLGPRKTQRSTVGSYVNPCANDPPGSGALA